MWRNKVVAVAVPLLAGMLLSGCGRREKPYITNLALELHEDSKEDMQSTEKEEPRESIVQSVTTEETEKETGEEPHERWEYVDFSVIEENHEILEYNICTEPRYNWEDTLLREELRQEQDEHEEFAERFNSIGDADVRIPFDFNLDYFPFDFNDDGLEDYLVCISSWEYCGSGGNSVRIYMQEESGTLRLALSITARLHEDGIHARFTILNEKTDGYYAIVLPGSNRILRYDSDTGWYEFHEGE